MAKFNITSNLRGNLQHGLYPSNVQLSTITFKVKEVRKNFRCCMCKKSFPLNVEKQLIMSYHFLWPDDRKPSGKPHTQVIGRVCGDTCFNVFLLAWPDIYKEVFGSDING